MIHVVGGGLAGSEAAWQAAELGVPVTIHEMRPVRPTAVHKTDGLAELVCSNSFRGDKLDNAVGLLKEEMRRLGSLIMRAADAARVPAGAALAVDRVVFSTRVSDEIARHPRITVRREEVGAIPQANGGWSPVIIATGPLTSDALSADIRAFVGADHLYFYDAISPIVLADTIDMSKVFRASRWDRSFRAAGEACGVDDGQGDYLNCPFTKDEYDAFYQAIITAESATVHDFDKAKFFEGCLPIEVMAHRGVDTLRFGPMKPVGLIDPRTGRVPYAVVQLRQDTLAGDHFSLVGFQTQLKWGEQARVLRMIPGLEQAEFVRFGMVHRNTYINGPTVLRETWQTRRRADLFFAGQVSGVEGYVESAASGLIAGRNAAALVLGHTLSTPPRTTAIGALAHYVSHAEAGNYQPSNITHGIMAPLENPPKDKLKKKMLIAERALRDLATWQNALGGTDMAPAVIGAAGQ
jgi:methylenetetrahydrofolate--tRNA-(uracil-5-)-methyltransferase